MEPSLFRHQPSDLGDWQPYDAGTAYAAIWWNALCCECGQVFAIEGGGMIQAATVLYASADHPDSITEAREYIKRMGLTADDVRLIRKQGSVLVIAKRNLNWGK